MVQSTIGKIRPTRVEDEMRSSYLDYAMSVIVARALPDVRDGLKPVHRRILYAMDEMGLRFDRPFRKSARIVGEVLGKFHPHGETAIYDSLVRMAQGFSLRYVLVDGQGNFGSVDNDPPAAMRYTEARLAAIAQELLADIDRDTVDFVPNFDDSLREPTVLPTRLPNLLVNGSSGIAVGMATNIPPHNLGEVCDAITHLLDNPEATAEELAIWVQGPDFPTGGIILGREGITNAHATGKGRVLVRARARIEEASPSGRTQIGRTQIVVTELPYQVNKAALVERIADLVRERKLEGISDLRDESDRQGMRIVLELRREAQPTQVLNALYKHTAMQSAFFVNMLALVDGQPRVLGLRAILQHHIDFRRSVIVRRSRFDLKKAQERAHILEGLKKALDNLNAVIRVIRESENAEAARAALMQRFRLTEVQASAILDMQLRRLAALERRRLEDELVEVLKTIAYLEDLLGPEVQGNLRKIDPLIKEELQELKRKYGDARRTQISQEEAAEFTREDLIPHGEMVVTLSQRGYIKRLLTNTYRLQGRGGRGVAGMHTREEDVVHRLLVADTHDSLLFFTNRGKVFQLRCYEVPDASRQSRGTPLRGLVALAEGESVTEVLRVEDFQQGSFLVMATRKGEVKKTPLIEFDSVRSNGLIAMDLEAGDDLIAARMARPREDILLVTEMGQAVRFSEGGLRSASRQSGGVRGMRLAPGDQVVGMDIAVPGAFLLTVTALGYGKRTSVADYRRTGRGGSGVQAAKLNADTGPIAAAQVVQVEQEVMIISAEGIVIRTSLASIASQGRYAQGVRVMRPDSGDRVVAVACADGGLADTI